MNSQPHFSRWHYAGLFLTTLATLLLELVLTRIFSVTLWYHFAFMSVSLALFGLSAAGIFLYIFNNWFKVDRTTIDLARLTSAFALSLLLVAAILLNRQAMPEVTPTGMLNLAVIYILSSIPFFLSGLAIALVMARYTERISYLYFYDLAGAALGCIILIPLLDYLGGIDALFFIALVAAGGAFCFYAGKQAGWIKQLAPLFIILFLWGANQFVPVIDIKFIKGFYVKAIFDVPPIFQKWNSFSMVTLFHWNDIGYKGYQPNFDTPFMKYLESEAGKPRIHRPDGEMQFKKFTPLDMFKKVRGYTSWAKSEKYEGEYPQQLALVIDGAAGTWVTKFNGDPKELEYQKYEITAPAYYLRPESEVLIIGPGGGPDVLTAIAFHCKKIECVELNPLIVKAVDEVAGDFSGHLYSRPDVKVNIDEGRSFIRRSTKKYDLIQASLIDTWAATAAGAYSLSENTLYTVEAFSDYLDHLKDDGIFTMSRFIFRPPRQSLRVAALGVTALEQRGIVNPEKHIFILKKKNVSTFLMKKSPFTLQEVQNLETICRELNFEILFSPLTRKQNFFSGLILGQNRDAFYREYPFEVTPCYDDRPFFFNMVRPSNVNKILQLRQKKESGVEVGQYFNYDAVIILVTLLSVATVLVFIFIVGPMLLRARKLFVEYPYTLRTVLYFSALGLGFMLIEIALLQKFILFLGHPVYSLAVILFSLLVSSSLGSLLTSKFTRFSAHVRAAVAIGWVILLVFIYTKGVFPFLFEHCIGWDTWQKIPLTVLMLIPLGLGMGMPFPLGLHIIRVLKQELVPWIWGINGATSVLGSILAFALALSYGFTATLQIGQVVYLVGLLSILTMRNKE